MKNTLRQRVNAEGIVKLILTSLLSIYAIIVSIKIGNPFVAAMPMFISSLGDINLMKNRNVFYNKDKMDFRHGVLFFMFAHIFYLNDMQTKFSLTALIIMVVMVFMFVIFAFIVKIKDDTKIVPFYAIVLITSVINTFFFNKVAFIGGLLFFISDSLIGLFILLKKNGMDTQVAIWATYVPAQILLLTSLML